MPAVPRDRAADLHQHRRRRAGLDRPRRLERVRVGLLNALHAYRGERVSAGQLAEEACHIEIDVLGQPIGKQDQYAAAFGGLNVFRFGAGGRVTVEQQHLANGQRDELFESMLMFWTGHQRDASERARGAERETSRRSSTALRGCATRSTSCRSCCRTGRSTSELVGALLDEGWRLKRELAPHDHQRSASTRWYEQALAPARYGGKLCGAGGGGFLLFLAPPERHDAVRAALADLVEVPDRRRGARLARSWPRSRRG